jgi:hypothetical protein
MAILLLSIGTSRPKRDRLRQGAIAMTRQRTFESVAVTLMLLAGGVANAKPVEFSSRVAYAPLVAKLKASGGSAEHILHLERAADLARLASGKRYKFVVDVHGQMAIAPLPADASSNEYVHPILAGGGPVWTGGGIVVDHAGGQIAHVVVDQDSKSYCPTSASLVEAVHALTRAGVAESLIRREDRPPQCAPPK